MLHIIIQGYGKPENIESCLTRLRPDIDHIIAKKIIYNTRYPLEFRDVNEWQVAEIAEKNDFDIIVQQNWGMVANMQEYAKRYSPRGGRHMDWLLFLDLDHWIDTDGWLEAMLDFVRCNPDCGFLTTCGKNVKSMLWNKPSRKKGMYHISGRDVYELNHPKDWGIKLIRADVANMLAPKYAHGGWEGNVLKALRLVKGAKGYALGSIRDTGAYIEKDQDYVYWKAKYHGGGPYVTFEEHLEKVYPKRKFTYNRCRQPTAQIKK